MICAKKIVRVKLNENEGFHNIIELTKNLRQICSSLPKL